MFAGLISLWILLAVPGAETVPFEDVLLDRSSLPPQPPGSNFYDTSEFTLGSVGMVYILAESDGSIDPNLENWTSAELDTVTVEVPAGLEWWIDKAKWRDLSFHPIFHYNVPAGYQPISRPRPS